MKIKPEIPLPQNLVTFISNRAIRLENVSSNLIDSIKILGACKSELNRKVIWTIPFKDEYDLSEKLQDLNKFGMLFVGEPTGWPPASIFVNLREKNLVKGIFNEVTWSGPGKWIVQEK